MKEQIQIAVVGSRESGKTAITAHLTDLAVRTQSPLHFTEIHNLDDLHSHQYDVVLQVVDCTDLEHSLMLTPHIIDESHKIVLAFNRYDLLVATHHTLNVAELKHLMGVPLDLVNAQTGEGMESIMRKLIIAHTRPESTAHPIYHAWEQANEDAYRAYIHGVLHQTLTHPENDIHSFWEKIDRILTNKWFGFPILIALLCFVFECTFAIGEPIQHWMQLGIESIYTWANDLLPAGWLRSLIGDGIIIGVGSLLTALPNIIILFFFLSLMEDTGYMARVAFIMDGIMHRLGLHGRSFIPMLMGFDCNVPAIMAAKDIHNHKDRALTMLMIPFMSCSARLPVYILFINVFFSQHKALVLLSLYVIGIVLSFGFALIMKRTPWFKKPDEDCVNELPQFKVPSIRSIGGHIWYRVEDFLKKISTVVLCASIVIWALEFFPMQDLEHLESSWLAAVGRFIEPLMQPLGFDWKMSVCLLTGLPAKEAIVSTFAILYNGDITSAGFTPSTAYGFLVFTLLYFPCVATISTIRKELGWKWATFSVINSLTLAWLTAAIVSMDKILVIGIVIAASLILIRLVWQQRKLNCDGACPDCPIRGECKESKKC